MKNTRALVFAMAVWLPLTLLHAQNSTPSAAPPPANLPPATADVVRLTRSGVGDDVVVAFVQNASIVYNLSATDVLALKNAGISSTVLAAMLNHDAALRPQLASATPAPSTPAPPTAYPGGAPAAAPAPTAPQPPPAPAPSEVAAAAPALAPTTVVVQQAPPPAPVEVIPVSPGPEFIWASGYWSWSGVRWVWVNGCWAHKPHPESVWIGGHWSNHGHGYVWMGGGWH